MSDPPTITLSDPNSSSTAAPVSSSSSKSTNAGAIGGGVTGGVVLVLLVIGLLLFLRRRRARNSRGGPGGVMGAAGGRNASTSSESSLTESGKAAGPGSSGSHYTPHSQMAQLNHSGGSGIINPSYSTSALTTPVDAPAVPAIPQEYATSTPARSHAASPTPSAPVIQKVKRVPVRYSEDELAQAEEEARKVAAQPSTTPP